MCASLCCCFGLYVTLHHVNAVDIDAGDMARPRAKAATAQFLYLPLEVPAEDVVDHRVVHSGALSKDARQETDSSGDGATVLKNRPQTYEAIWQPAA